MKAEIIVRQVEQALEPLTWCAERQLELISQLGVGTDELALEFDDALQSVRGAVGSKLLPNKVLEALTPVDQALAEMTLGPQQVWETTAVINSRAWADLRTTAKDSLNKLKTINLDAENP